MIFLSSLLCRFRWVFCQLEVLRHCLPASIRLTLDQLPESLDETYLRVLSQIPQANQAHAHRMLQCLMVAVRPLRVEELAELLAFEFDAAQGGIPKYRAAWLLDNQTQAVLSTCSSLVTIVGDHYSDSDSDLSHPSLPGVVQFSHFSVKEFLISNRLRGFSRFHIRPASAHTILTQACLGCLLHVDNYIDKSDVRRFPLARYAAQYWVEHAQFEDVAPCVKDGMELLFDPDKPHFAAWIGLFDIDQPYWLTLSDSETSLPKPTPNPLYYSVLCGFYDLVKHLAIKHPQLVNATFGQYRFPLFAAVLKGYIEVAELLLKHGADINARDTTEETTGETILLKVLSQCIPPSRYTPQDSRPLVKLERPLEVAQMLVRHNADVNSHNGLGRTPLHSLSECRIDDEGGVLNLALLLLKHGAEVDTRDKHNRTPLHLTVRRDRSRLARILLEHGADANMEDYNGRTPLHMLSERQIYDTSGFGNVLQHKTSWLEHGVGINIHKCDTPLFHPNFGPVQIADTMLDCRVNGGETPPFQELEGECHIRYEVSPLHANSPECGVGVLQNQDPSTVTPLHLATLHDEELYCRIAQALLDYGATVDAVDKLGRTPLHLVANVRHYFEHDLISVAKLLLENGADVNAEDKDNVNPLCLASYNGSLAIARVLLAYGAAPNSKDNKGKSPLHLVAQGRHLYSKDGCIGLSQLLLECGADVNSQDEDHRTPLHVASYYRKVEIARVLLDGNAGVSSKGDQGQTPLHVAAEGHSRDGDVLTRLLLVRGADVNALDDEDETPLHLASYFGTVKTVEVLVNAGANANAKNAQGQTPLHLVSQLPYDSRGSFGVTQLLLEHGADVNAQDSNGATPSDLASHHGRTEITSLLSHYGGTTNANVDQRPTPRRLGLKRVQFPSDPVSCIWEVRESPTSTLLHLLVLLYRSALILVHQLQPAQCHFRNFKMTRTEIRGTRVVGFVRGLKSLGSFVSVMTKLDG